MPEQTKPKLRWYQFSLRTLLLFVTAVAVFMSWFAVKMKQAQRQKEIVGKLGFVVYDYELDKDGNFNGDAKPHVPDWMVNLLGIDFFANVVEVARLNGKYGEDETLEILDELPELRKIELSPSDITDKLLEKLSILKSLRSLVIMSGGIFDAENITSREIAPARIASLKTLSNLEELRLDSEQIMDAEIGVLKDLPRLKVLSLKETKITDTGLQNLKNLSHLEHLELDGEHLTDAALECLQNLKSLRYLSIDFESFTSVGLKHLTRLNQIQDLFISGSLENGDLDLQCLAELPQLKILSIHIQNPREAQPRVLNFKIMQELRELYIHCDLKIDDAELESLAEFPRLQKLDIHDNQLSGSDLVHLKNLSRIEKLYIFSDQISNTETSELHEALPNAHINSYGTTSDAGEGMGIF
jgi:Leucine-rich repeat (LRR) protein